MTTLADILAAGGGHLPAGWDASAHALLIPDAVYQAVMAEQAQNTPAGWQHRVEPVVLDGAIHHGIGADVLTEAEGLGIFAHIFSGLDRTLAASVLVVPWPEFEALLPPPPPEAIP
jgi:hypothetical protein